MQQIQHSFPVHLARGREAISWCRGALSPFHRLVRHPLRRHLWGYWGIEARWRSLSQTWFLPVVNHGIDPRLIDPTHNYVDVFFSLPLPEKQRAQRKPGESCGYASDRFTSKLLWKETLSFRHSTNRGKASLFPLVFNRWNCNRLIETLHSLCSLQQIVMAMSGGSAAVHSSPAQRPDLFCNQICVPSIDYRDPSLSLLTLISDNIHDSPWSRRPDHFSVSLF